MARIKVCGVCWKPVRECICEDGEAESSTEEDASEF